MKKWFILSCFVVCACTPYYVPSYAPAYAPQPTLPAPAFAYPLQPPVYESHLPALEAKTTEVLAKEKALLTAQNELYKREKMLANREADFINRARALDYQEQKVAAAPSPVAANSALNEDMRVRQKVVVVQDPVVVKKYTQPELTYVQQAPQNLPAPAAATVLYDNQEVVLQHPIQRDLVRCEASDVACLQIYERFGYEQSPDLSQLSQTDELVVTESSPYPVW